MEGEEAPAGVDGVALPGDEEQVPVLPGPGGEGGGKEGGVLRGGVLQPVGHRGVEG